MYKGKQPCPGCGRTGEEHPRYNKDGLCQECALKLKLGREVSDFYGMEYGMVRMPELSRCEMTWYRIPKFQDALKEFFETITNFSPDFAKHYGDKPADQYIIGDPGSSCGSDKLVLPTKSIEAAKKLCEALSNTAWEIKLEKDNMRKELMTEVDMERERIYNEGVAHGRNLLMQLNNGEISPNDFIKPCKYKPNNQ